MSDYISLFPRLPRRRIRGSRGPIAPILWPWPDPNLLVRCDDERKSMKRFRVGRSLGRTIYRVVGDEASKEDVFMGLMDTREWAAVVVAALNAYYDDDQAKP